MKRKYILWIFLVCGFFLLTGCRNTLKETENSQDPVQEAEKPAETCPEEQQILSEDNLFPKKLDSSQLREFTRWINTGNNRGNYGFLLSEYTCPQDIDLSEVFYAGAGLECEPLSLEEQEAFLAATGQDEIYTDYTRLTSAQIDDFLQKSLGLSHEEMTFPLQWTYLPDYDIYVMEHGDTNYMSFTCVSGRWLDADTCELDCVPGDDVYTPYRPSCRLTLRKSKEGYRPVSNCYVEGISYSMDIWKLEEQCFSADLEGWGEVLFESYAPDRSAYGNRDVIFTLRKPGEELYKLPVMETDNYRRYRIFQQILAVSFQDYDEDGDTDIIVLSEYLSQENPEKEETVRETRLYRNHSDKQEFTLDFDWMDMLDANQWNHSIGEIMEHMDDL